MDNQERLRQELVRLDSERRRFLREAIEAADASEIDEIVMLLRPLLMRALYNDN